MARRFYTPNDNPPVNFYRALKGMWKGLTSEEQAKGNFNAAISKLTYIDRSDPNYIRQIHHDVFPLARFDTKEALIFQEIENRYQEAYNAAPLWAVTQFLHLHDQLCRNYLPGTKLEDALQNVEMRLRSHNGASFPIQRHRPSYSAIALSEKWHIEQDAANKAKPFHRRIFDHCKQTPRMANSWSPRRHFKIPSA